MVDYPSQWGNLWPLRVKSVLEAATISTLRPLQWPLARMCPFWEQDLKPYKSCCAGPHVSISRGQIWAIAIHFVVEKYLWGRWMLTTQPLATGPNRICLYIESFFMIFSKTRLFKIIVISNYNNYLLKNGFLILVFYLKGNSSKSFFFNCLVSLFIRTLISS